MKWTFTAENWVLAGTSLYLYNLIQQINIIIIVF